MHSRQEKFDVLKSIIGGLRSVIVAFSGGVDSTFLLKVCRDVLGDRVVAVTAVSEVHPLLELERAKGLAVSLGVEHIIMRTEELSDENFVANTPDRCYYCKMGFFKKLEALRCKRGIDHVVHGATASDRLDFRPGSRAASELGVLSPLADANLSKDDIRELSRQLGLPTWNLASMPCLSSRIPYGTRITVELLRRIARCEDFLHDLGFSTVRVRYHDDIARVEISPTDFGKILDDNVRTRIIKLMQKEGFVYITLDLMGYREGSMNASLFRTDDTMRAQSVAQLDGTHSNNAFAQ